MKVQVESDRVIVVQTPIDEQVIRDLRIGDKIEIQGIIYCGRDAVLPKLVEMIEQDDLDSITVNLVGAVIFHTAVSPAGIGPTTSNKAEIEENIPALAKAGVKIHLGKGSLSQNTVEELYKHNSVFAITPPVSALLNAKIVSQRVLAFKNEGMEALYEVEVKGLPAIIAIAQGESVFSLRECAGDQGC
jgi:fumarate hydratase subunit beta